MEALNKQIQDLDGKSQSLQLTIDRLSSALTRTEDEECQQKDKVNKSLGSGTILLKHYHKTLRYTINLNSNNLISTCVKKGDRVKYNKYRVSEK